VFAAFATTVTSFVPPSAFISRGVTIDSTILYISSWGTKGPPSRWTDDTTERKSPEDKIQSYLRAPQPIEARDNIDGTVLVCCLVRSKERTDQFLFDLLNNEESAFAIKKIVALSTMKNLPRNACEVVSARYTGLLDKLDFIQSSVAGALPTWDQLNGVKSWIAVL
jgi:hypothetical protein